MRVEVKVLKPSIDSEESCSVSIDVKNVRKLNANYIRGLVWKVLEEDRGHRANPRFEIPETDAIVKKFIDMPVSDDTATRFRPLEHYAKKWKAFYNFGFGSPATVYGKDEQTAKLEALALYRKSRAIVDEWPLEKVVDRVELAV